MIPATFFTWGPYLGNKQFDASDKILNRDDCLRGFYLLKKTLREHGVDLSTQDVNPPENSAFILFNDMPLPRHVPRGKKCYLLLFESALIRPDNWNMERHARFDRIFTWRDDLVDGKKYFKINYYSNILSAPKPETSKKEKLCAMIANNKYVRSPLELYSRRVEAVRWFEKNHPEDFDLYGGGWDDRPTLKSAAKALLNFAPERIFERKFPSYRGRVESKNAALQKYKFAICYENARGIPGYITEKIIDCLAAGCVPVYWGAPNIADHIPKEAFIDFTSFSGYESLYRYLRNMPENEYAGYLDAGKNFLTGEKGRAFSAEFFANQVSARILEDFKNF
ncbi:MAG TPA: glycosyltransferase family 10 [Elusimicrobiota bacterium]|nr:glycosyltransferase family 10 [Elusimicrobiota bacterium]